MMKHILTFSTSRLVCFHSVMDCLLHVQEDEVGATLQMMTEVADDLPAWFAGNRRRAGCKLDGEWTRSVVTHVTITCTFHRGS